MDEYSDSRQIDPRFSREIVRLGGGEGWVGGPNQKKNLFGGGVALTNSIGGDAGSGKKTPDLRSLEAGISVSQTNKSVDHGQNTSATTTVTR